MRPTRPGATIMELLVVLTLLGVLASVAILTIPGTRQEATQDLSARVSAARRQALRTGRPVTVVADTLGHEITALPDGRIVADTLPLDPRTGRRTGDQ